MQVKAINFLKEKSIKYFLRKTDIKQNLTTLPSIMPHSTDQADNIRICPQI